MILDNETFMRELIEYIEPIIKNSELYKLIQNFIIDFKKLSETTDKITLESIKNLIMDEVQHYTYSFRDEEKQSYQNVLSNRYTKADLYILLLFYNLEIMKEFLKGIGFIFYNIENDKKNHYSAYPTNITKENFVNKNIIWVTERYDQALLHPLDNKQIKDPIIFQFKFRKYLILLQSNEFNNEKIFDEISIELTNKFIEFMNKNPLNGFTRDNIYLGNNNINILYIIEAINRIIENDFFTFNGYINMKDQCEIAVLDFKQLVDRESVKKYVYTKIVYNGVEKTFPLETTRDIRQFYDIEGFYKTGTPREDIPNFLIPDAFVQNRNNIKSRMTCHNKNFQIYYQIEDKSTPESIFNCLNFSLEDFWRNKYLKYKLKYQKLKKLNNL